MTTRLRALAVLLPAIALLVLGSMSLAERAFAAWYSDDETGPDGRLVLETDRDPSTLLVLRADRPVYWMVAAGLEDHESGTLSLAMAKSGPLAVLPAGLRLAVDLCSSAWEGAVSPTCPGGARHILDATPADDFTVISPEWQLGPIEGGDRQYLLVTLALPPEAAADPAIDQGRGTLGLRLTARSIDPVPGGGDGGEGGGAASDGAGSLGAPGRLAVTGSEVVALVAAAVGLVGVGVGALMLRREGSSPR
ncbi:hypothetical protein [Herbiconiux sp. L3-i23]|uniref:hypothetical protein n=1 Tax=Herbiconiux sp. L3-i23 TaxID=2905871 RepID=UPI00204D4309|nr:hypothetical protein [Herbiconiux sp. L3-i23]BDI21508.1 hypothetical protein L3i23_02840 [Herbiconiux sp. L3-i23]